MTATARSTPILYTSTVQQRHAHVANLVHLCDGGTTTYGSGAL